MKYAELISQGERYFSQSQGQFIMVNDMPLPYALNVYRKLFQEVGAEFANSPLARSLASRLMPSSLELERILRSQGKASHLLAMDTDSVRSKFYRAAKRMGRKVTTHTKGDFMEGTCESDGVNIRVKERR